ncbi:MAG: cell division protein FtsX [Bacteroidetes bacterium CG02_land_8_20_14_3_00_31_25]|nr:ABC transporter permease [Bacteroidota bacterium]PIV59376.1 MAG: cell division protein FtsX [Bacteroidetes bacterium CG02_land_8_20_14_3_00_31_25]PIX32956.1 MAG: cell division protein FtsX [Bacteroidetes bacterium CG_4_8_14_3_um_filter_31_14]PIY02233.1 MAG: cell division protein FtsX [Bacteroidetes bacterium CG_4_10_14_3_um_filter_31_20]
MSQYRDKSIIRRLISSYITTVISISLVLFMLGLIGILALSSKRLSNYVKENISFSVFLKDDIKDADILKLQKNLDAAPYVKSTLFITKDMAAEQLKKDLGEEFVDYLEYNPLPQAIEVKYKAEYANPDSIALIERELKEYSQVSEVYYQKNLVSLINENVNRISLIVLAISILLLIVAIALINNTIRLSVYSKRFNIKTMQLVGATRGFIRWPFLKASVYQGIIASLISIALLSAVIKIADSELNSIISLNDFTLIGLLFGLEILAGVVITSFSSYFAVNKFLRSKSSELYY